MRALFDVNALIAMFDQGHEHHSQARAWWSANSSFGWASCPITENGFLRVTTQAQYREKLSIMDAYRLYDKAVATGHHVFWPDDVSVMDPSLVSRDHVLGPKQITDIYLLGLAVSKDGRLVTFDRAISTAAVRSAEPRHLVRLP